MQYFGSKVYATAGSSKVFAVKKLGAMECFDYKKCSLKKKY